MDLNFEPEQQHGGPCRHSPTRMRRPAPQPSTARPMEVDAAQDVRPAVGLESPILPPAQPKPSAGKAKAALSFDDRSGDSSDEDGAHQPKPTPELSSSASDPPKPQAGQKPRFSFSGETVLSFEAYLRAREEITPLDGLKGAPKETAKVKNNTFIAQRRVTARQLLRDAFEQQLLPHEGDAGSALALFNEGGSVRKPIVVEDDDDE